MAGPRSRFLIFALIGCSAVAAAAQSERETAWRPSWRSMRFEPPRFGSHPVHGAASATLPPAAAGGGVAGIDECAYVLDDGTGENGIGVLSGGTTTWFNRFDQKSGCAVVTAIQVAWDSGGFLPPGVPAKVFLYEDPNDDGDPSDVTGAQLRALVQVTTANEDTDIFNDYPIPPTLVSGSFFVGATIANGAGEFPARLDQSSSALSSWLSSNPSNPNDPVGTGTAPILVDTIGLPGNLMVRAVGAPVEASCAGDTNADGLVNVSDLVNVIIDWGSDGSANGGNVIDEGPSAGVVDVTDLLQIILDWGPCALGAPPNDQCLSAIDLSLPGFAFGQTITATADPEAFPCGGPVGAAGHLVSRHRHRTELDRQSV